MPRTLSRSTLAAIALSLPAMAQAQAPVITPDVNPELSAQLFRHSMDSERTLWSDDSGFIADDLSGNFRLATNYVDDPFIIEWSDGSTQTIVTQAWQVDVMGTVHYDRFRLGVRIPAYLTSGGEFADGGAGLSDIGAELRATLLDRADAPVGLAINLRGGFPTTTVDVPMGDSTEFEGGAILDGEIENLLLTLNAGYRLAPDTELLNVVWGDQLAIRGGGGYLINTTTISLEAAMSASLANLGASTTTPTQGAAVPIEAVLGMTQELADSLRLQLGAGKGLTRGIGSPAFRVLAALEWRPPREKDTDGDGIVDSKDICPDDPEDFDGLDDEDGCPDEFSEVWISVVDGTGTPIEGASLFANGAQEQPTPGSAWNILPGTWKVDVKAEGYVAKVETIDAVSDAGVQKFTVTLEPAVALGTLVVVVRNEDGGLFEDAKISLDRGEMKKGAEHKFTLPPGEFKIRAIAGDEFKAENRVAAVEEDQTTRVEITLEKAQVVITGDRIELKDSVYFDTARATIQSKSFSLLDEVVQILTDHPELKKLRIEGHTDSRGSASYNKKLSQQRADSVRNFLIEKGIDADRLQAMGYGEEQPLDKAENEAAWEKNRRVDFFVIERTD